MCNVLLKDALLSFNKVFIRVLYIARIILLVAQAQMNAGPAGVYNGNL